MSDRINRRATITQFHKAWHPPCEIFKHLKHEGVKRSTVYGIIKRYSEASSVSDKKKVGWTSDGKEKNHGERFAGKDYTKSTPLSKEIGHTVECIA